MLEGVGKGSSLDTQPSETLRSLRIEPRLLGVYDINLGSLLASVLTGSIISWLNSTARDEGLLLFLVTPFPSCNSVSYLKSGY